MKRLVCEMCGSSELMKQDDRYVCMSCGTSYSTEEAKKLFVEVSGSVDVSGSTVKVDNSSFIQKQLENARRAKEKEDWEECEKYYNMVEQYEPNHIEALFYSSYGKAKLAMVESDRFKREQKLNVLQKTISIIDDNYAPEPERYEENKAMLIQINNDLMALVTGNFVYTAQTVNGVESKYNDKEYTYAMFRSLSLAWIESLQNIIKMIPSQKDTAYLFYMIRTHYAYIYSTLSAKNKSALQEYENKIRSTDEILKRLDSSYVPKQLQTKSGGCYVATCVYGSYDCPQVWTLRRYRDDTLAKTWYGRAFVRTYYAVSPTMVQLFGNTKWFRRLWKGTLDHMVRNLQEKGVADTPYQDKEWKV